MKLGPQMHTQSTVKINTSSALTEEEIETFLNGFDELAADDHIDDYCVDAPNISPSISPGAFCHQYNEKAVNLLQRTLGFASVAPIIKRSFRIGWQSI